MEKELRPRRFSFERVFRLSPEQLRQHYQLYLGYVNKVNEVRRLLLHADKEAANATYSEFRGLKLGEGYAINGVKLHEDYFENIVEGRGGPPVGPIREEIERRFGSVEEWRRDFVATGLAARGWAVLAFDPRDGSLHHYLQDAHDQGVVTAAVPLLVLDVYEHAYFIDFGIRKTAYIETFLQMINWEVVNRRWQERVCTGGNP